MPMRRYAIIGTGALGGFYGARLQRTGLDVHFLLQSDYDHVRRHGLIIESKDGDFSLPRVAAYRDVRDMPRADVVVVALKTTQNHLLPALIPPVLKDDGVVLVMQNGLGAEAQIAAQVGPQRVMGGLCFLCANKVGPGHIRHLDYGLVTLAEHARRGVSARMESMAAEFARAGIPTQLAPDLAAARWRKLVWNIPYNGLSVILDATTAELMADAATRDLVEQIMREIAADARLCGSPVPDGTVAQMIEYTTNMKPYRTSMKIDYDTHRPLEVEGIFGNPLRAAQAAGGESPRLETLCRQLQFLDARNRRANS